VRTRGGRVDVTIEDALDPGIRGRARGPGADEAAARPLGWRCDGAPGVAAAPRHRLDVAADVAAPRCAGRGMEPPTGRGSARAAAGVARSGLRARRPVRSDAGAARSSLLAIHEPRADTLAGDDLRERGADTVGTDPAR